MLAITISDHLNLKKNTVKLNQCSGNPVYTPELKKRTSSRTVRIRRKTSCGTVGYRSPEVIRERNLRYCDRIGYDESSDWFSLGVTTYVLLAGKKPFHNRASYTKAYMDAYHPSSIASDVSNVMPIQNHETNRNSSNANFEFKSLMSRVHFSPAFPSAAADFCQQLLKRKPEHRMNFATLREHSWVKDIHFDATALKSFPADKNIMDYIENNWSADQSSATGPELTKSYAPDMVRRSKNGYGAHKSTGGRDISAPRWKSYADLHSSLIQVIDETIDNPEAATKEKKRWTIKLKREHDKLFDKWTYISKADLTEEMALGKLGDKQ